MDIHVHMQGETIFFQSPSVQEWELISIIANLCSNWYLYLVCHYCHSQALSLLFWCIVLSMPFTSFWSCGRGHVNLHVPIWSSHWRHNWSSACSKTYDWMSQITCTLLYFLPFVASKAGKALNVKYLMFCGDSIHKLISQLAHFSFCFLLAVSPFRWASTQSCLFFPQLSSLGSILWF